MKTIALETFKNLIAENLEKNANTDNKTASADELLERVRMAHLTLVNECFIELNATPQSIAQKAAGVAAYCLLVAYNAGGLNIESEIAQANKDAAECEL